MLEYAGPKPHISHTGIDFDNNKEDKYVYLPVVVELIKALSHDYFEDKKYVYSTDETRVDAPRLMHDLENLCPNLPDLVKKENVCVEEEIEDNIQRTHESRTLTDEDKTILENNINIMHDYLVQRAVNKSVYYCVIQVLADLLKKDHIDYIIVPMLPNFTHVLHSVQGALLKEKFPIDTTLAIYNEASKLLVKLQVINL
jgi:hypothetical protein